MARFPTFLIKTCRHLLTCMRHDGHMVCLHQETLCNNAGYEAKYGHFKLSITFLFMDRKSET